MKNGPQRTRDSLTSRPRAPDSTVPRVALTAFAYDSVGNLISTTDPLGQSTTRAYDALARLLSVTDPLGQATSFSYDPVNRLTQITDALGGLTQFAYDANGNLTDVTDAKGHTVEHVYDAMDRLSSRIDPLGQGEDYTYDPNGNLTAFTDRKGQVGTFTYDALNRRTGASHADGSTTTFSYDAVGRLTQASDSVGGTIANVYDVLDRLTQQTTGLGAMSYQYDAVGRRTTMTAAGQAAVSYAYDAASRLTQVVQGSQTVSLQHDALGRRTQLTLPNGVLTDYSYDAASRLTELIYQNALGPLGNLTYTYDAAGNRSAVGGSLARTGLPTPVPNATYDAANRQLTFGDKTLTYDANGNLTAITDPTGTTTYTWDARNQLVAITGPGLTASFQYDALGRRIRKTVNGTATDFLYDRLNSVQELSGGAVVANLLAGLGIDEYFTRTDTTGSQTLLTDALGSTVALTDSAGSVQTQYTYGPFGSTTVAGNPNTNPFQYTGRENDGTGLYYYRARYYHPGLQRFLGEDPLGFAAGDPNLYAYVLNNPISLRDPTGLIVMVCTRKAHAPIDMIGANHQYLYDPGSRQTCGSLDRGPENPAGDYCIPVPDSAVKEPEVMGCCRREVEMSRIGLYPKPYFPFFNDCFNVANRCLSAAGLRNPSSASRFGPPCGKCDPPQQPSAP